MAVRSSNGQLLVAGGVVVGAAIIAVMIERAERSIAWGNVGAILWWAAGLLLSIPAMSAITALCQRPLTRWFGAAGRIAAAGLRRAPGRTGVTVGVIALSLTVAIALASAARSFRESHRHLLTLVGDLVVSSVGTEGGWMESPLSGEVEGILAGIPGVARVETYRALQGQNFRGVRVAVVAVSPRFLDTPQFRSMVVAGDADAAVAAIHDDRAVVVSDNFADQFGLRPDDEITVPAPDGEMPVRISAVVTNDFTGDRGSIILNRDRFAAHWGGDTQVTHFNIYLEPARAPRRYAPQSSAHSGVSSSSKSSRCRSWLPTTKTWSTRPLRSRMRSSSWSSPSRWQGSRICSPRRSSSAGGRSGCCASWAPMRR
jgi:hypothetical protein